jgi:hypothetical protein
MGFAGPGADEDCVARGVREGGSGEFANLALIDRRIAEDEGIEILEGDFAPPMR